MGSGINQTLGYLDDPSTRCFPPCEFQKNDFSLSSTIFPSEAAFPYMNESCLVFQKIVQICQSNQYRQKLFEAKYPFLECNTIMSLHKSGALCNENFSPKLASIEINNVIRKQLFDYARANVAQVKIFFKDPFYSRLQSDEELPLFSFIGNVGGLLGLFLGLSMISIFEVIYYISSFFYKNPFKNLIGRNRIFKVRE